MTMEKTETTQEQQTARRQFTGEVVSRKTEKTAIVLVREHKMHPKYKKMYAVSKRFAVHDEKNVTKLGDNIQFEECRPYSKTKRWRVLQVLKTA